MENEHEIRFALSTRDSAHDGSKGRKLDEQATDDDEGMTPVPFRWDSSFPHRLRPFAEEWLPGPLLRYDAQNEWPYGTTLRLFYERADKKAVLAAFNFWVVTL